MPSDADCQALLAHLYRTLDLLPGLPPSMHITMSTFCLKAVRRLHQHGTLSDGEAYTLNARVRNTPTPQRIDCHE